MFARVITAQAGADGVDTVLDLAQQQLPGARERPGYQGYTVLADEESGKLLIISLWDTREQMEEVAQGTSTGVHEQGVEATGIASQHLETYEVKLQD